MNRIRKLKLNPAVAAEQILYSFSLSY